MALSTDAQVAFDLSWRRERASLAQWSRPRIGARQSTDGDIVICEGFECQRALAAYVYGRSE
jgi:hypothetical protein